MEVVIFYDKEAEWYKQCMSEPEMDCRLYFRPWEKVYENEWLEEGGPSLAAVVVNGAAGMNCCHEIRKRCRELPVLWVSDQEGFQMCIRDRGNGTVSDAGKIIIRIRIPKPEQRLSADIKGIRRKNFRKRQCIGTWLLRQRQEQAVGSAASGAA